MEEFNSNVIQLAGNVWDVAIVVPQRIGDRLALVKNRRVVRTINNNVTFQCALMQRGDGSYFININKEIRNKTGLELGDSLLVKLEPDQSEYGLPLPDELKSAWELDQEAYDVFHALTKGKQRSLIHVVYKPKSLEIRIKKALVMLEYLKSVNGKLDFKELNLALKNANKR